MWASSPADARHVVPAEGLRFPSRRSRDPLLRVRAGLGPGITERLEQLFAGSLEVGNFGNARFARSLFEQSFANMATRILEDGRIDRSEMDELLPVDLAPAEHALTTTHRPIGFRPR